MPYESKHGECVVENVAINTEKRVTLIFKNSQGIRNRCHFEYEEAKKLLCELYAMEELQ